MLINLMKIQEDGHMLRHTILLYLLNRLLDRHPPIVSRDSFRDDLCSVASGWFAFHQDLLIVTVLLDSQGVSRPTFTPLTWTRI